MSGIKHDQEKPDMSLLSPYALEAIAQVMTAGKAKYGADNWRGGIAFSRLYAAVQRHLTAYNRGEMKDPETGLSHLAHASCGLMMLLEFEATRPELNDLYHCKQSFKALLDEFLDSTEPEKKEESKVYLEHCRMKGCNICDGKTEFIFERDQYYDEDMAKLEAEIRHFPNKDDK